MFKKFAIIVMATLALTACGEPSRTVYNGRYAIERENEYIDRVTDLKTDKVQWKTKDGDRTEWFDPGTTWEEARGTWE